MEIDCGCLPEILSVRLMVVESPTLTVRNTVPWLWSQTPQGEQSQSSFSASCLQMQCRLFLLDPAPTPHPIDHTLSNCKTKLTLPSQRCLFSDIFCPRNKKNKPTQLVRKSIMSVSKTQDTLYTFLLSGSFLCPWELDINRIG